MPPSAFGRNIKAMREDKGLTQAELAEALQITSVTACIWETRDRVPKSKEVIDSILELFGCTRQDLFGFSDGYYAKRNGLTASKPITSNSYAPVLGNIAAGEPREAIEQNETHWVDPEILEAHPDGYFLRVSGDSMNLVLPNGCYAFIAPGEVASGDIAAVKVNGDEATIKRVKKYEGVVILEPESSNPEHRRRVIDENDPDAPAVRMLGKVIWYASNV